jgi:hypothetical protein
VSVSVESRTARAMSPMLAGLGICKEERTRCIKAQCSMAAMQAQPSQKATPNLTRTEPLCYHACVMKASACVCVCNKGASGATRWCLQRLRLLVCCRGISVAAPESLSRPPRPQNYGTELDAGTTMTEIATVLVHPPQHPRGRPHVWGEAVDGDGIPLWCLQRWCVYGGQMSSRHAGISRRN